MPRPFKRGAGGGRGPGGDGSGREDLRPPARGGFQAGGALPGDTIVGPRRRPPALDGGIVLSKAGMSLEGPARTGGPTRSRVVTNKGRRPAVRLPIGADGDQHLVIRGPAARRQNLRASTVGLTSTIQGQRQFSCHPPRGAGAGFNGPSPSRCRPGGPVSGPGGAAWGQAKLLHYKPRAAERVGRDPWSDGSRGGAGLRFGRRRDNVGTSPSAGDRIDIRAAGHVGFRCPRRRQKHGLQARAGPDGETARGRLRSWPSGWQARRCRALARHSDGKHADRQSAATVATGEGQFATTSEGRALSAPARTTNTVKHGHSGGSRANGFEGDSVRNGPARSSGRSRCATARSRNNTATCSREGKTWAPGSHMGRLGKCKTFIARQHDRRRGDNPNLLGDPGQTRSRSNLRADCMILGHTRRAGNRPRSFPDARTRSWRAAQQAIHRAQAGFAATNGGTACRRGLVLDLDHQAHRGNAKLSGCRPQTAGKAAAAAAGSRGQYSEITGSGSSAAGLRPGASATNRGAPRIARGGNCLARQPKATAEGTRYESNADGQTGGGRLGAAGEWQRVTARAAGRWPRSRAAGPAPRPPRRPAPGEHGACRACAPGGAAAAAQPLQRRPARLVPPAGRLPRSAALRRRGPPSVQGNGQRTESRGAPGGQGWTRHARFRSDGDVSRGGGRGRLRSSSASAQTPWLRAPLGQGLTPGRGHGPAHGKKVVRPNR